MKKYVALALILITLSLFLASCNAKDENELPEGAIPVLSNYLDISYITPGEYDTSKYEDGVWARYGYSTYVCEVNGKLAILPNHSDGSSIGGGVSTQTLYTFDNISGSDNGVYLDENLVIDEKCVGMLPSHSKEKLIAFTTTENYGKAYVFEKNEDGAFELSNQMIDVEGEVYLIYYNWETNGDDPEKLYVITSEGVVILDIGDFLHKKNATAVSVRRETLNTPEWWRYMKPTSVAKTDDGTVFVGEREGVIGIFPNGEIKYYPVNYIGSASNKK